MIPQAPILYIETEIVPRYEQFDKAHNLLHVQAVIEGSLVLAKLYPEADEHLVCIVVAYHDTELCQGCVTYHLALGEIIAEDVNLLQWSGKEEIEIVCEVVEDHWVSTDHEPRSIYGKIVAETDRIIDPDTTLCRTVQHGLKQNPVVDETWHYQRSYDHLTEKYAPGGHLKLWFPHSKNTRQLRKLQAIITDRVRLGSIFHQMFEEEKR